MPRNKIILLILAAAFVMAACLPSGKYVKSDNMVALTLSLADPAWDGKNVPPGQQCNRFGGQGATPKLMVKGIPAEANALILEFSDRSYQPMNNGGHGKIGYRIQPGTTETVVPSVPGHTFDLPAGFFLVSAQRNPSWDRAGAYMPPCSGGKGNTYAVTVKAVVEPPEGQEGKLLGQADLVIGRY